MKKILCLIISLLLIVSLTTFGASASETYQSGDFYYTILDGEATITRCETTKAHLIIPDFLDGYPVVAIGDRAFEDMNCIRKVTISENVKRIGEYAFFGCKNLMTITLTGDCEEIGDYAFGYEGVFSPSGEYQGVTEYSTNIEFFVYEHFSKGYWTLKQYCRHTFKNVTSIDKHKKLGDADFDNEITVRDATLIQKYIANLDYTTALQRLNGDINRDKKVDISDATAIQKSVAGLDYNVETRRIYIKVPDFWVGHNVYLSCDSIDYTKYEYFDAAYDEESNVYYADVPCIFDLVRVFTDAHAEVYTNDVIIPDEGIGYIRCASYRDGGIYMGYTFEWVEVID